MLEREKDPWKNIYKFLQEETVKEMVTIERKYEIFTSGRAKTTRYLLNKYFPKKDGGKQHGSSTEQINQGAGQENVILITRKEVGNVCKDIGANKANGEDKLGIEVVESLVRVKGDYLVKLMNRCLREGVFPEVWKRTRVVLIGKIDGGTRPISNEPVLGKVLDKILADRVRYWSECENVIDDRQYGFRENISTIESIK